MVEALRGGGAWRERVNEWNGRIGKWNKEANEWNKNKEAGEKRPKYAGVGVVVIAFEVHCPQAKVHFGLQMELPLEVSKLAKKGYDRTGQCWAERLADMLSHDPPTERSFEFFRFPRSAYRLKIN